VFDVIGDLGAVPLPDREATFNLGIGMILVVDGAAVATALDHLVAGGTEAWVIGQVSAGKANTGPGVVQGTKGVNGGAVTLMGAYRN
jgi:phosphoribosylformylglycinamidine cyclo-ligase